MIEFENKETSLIKEGDEKMTYADLIILCVNKPVETGITIQEMKENFRLIDIAEKGGKQLSFEDADFAVLKNKITTMRWGANHRDIITFAEDIKNG